MANFGNRIIRAARTRAISHKLLTNPAINSRSLPGDYL